MAISKVEFDGKTLMDLTEDSVSEENLLQGETAHNAKGEKVVGGVTVPDKISQLENDVSFRPVKHVTLAEYQRIPDEEKDSDNVVYMVDDGNPTVAVIDVAMDALAEYGVLSGQKRYIQGNDSVVSPYLAGYDTAHVETLEQVHVDHLYAKVGDSWAEVGEQTLTLDGGVLGKNYYIQCDGRGALSITDTREDSRESTCIGGFHYGRVRLSRTPSDVTVGIVPNSVWTLRWCPECRCPDAMVHLGNKLWGDIYLTRAKHNASTVDGPDAEVHESSSFGELPATGTEGFCQFTFTECLSKVGKRLPMNDEFVAAADGSPIGLDNANTNAWSATSNTSRATCGTVANAISFFNVVDLVGNVWKWNADKYELNNPNLAYSWHTVSDVKGDVYGPGSYGLGALVSGGYWGDGSRGGSRCVSVNRWPWRVDVSVGAWAVAESR